MYRVIRASEEFDEFDEPIFRKRYMVCGGSSCRDTDDPATAIRYWFMLGKQHPTDTAISCATRQDAIALCQAATADLLTALWNKYRCPYKLDFLIEAAAKQVDKQCSSFYENEFGDMVFPFDVG